MFAAAAFIGCSKATDRQLLLPEDPLLRERLERDAAFKSGRDSPIPPEDRPRFQGLSYYPIDLGLRFKSPLYRYSSPQAVRLGTNTGEIRSGLRYGYFQFEIDGEICRLQVYRLEDAADVGGAYLFVPFRDSTTGRETYAAGRYIDLKENTNGVYELDFNRAYNPLCAYGGTFSCPLPPAENTLSVPIQAGEKKYRLSVDH